MHIKNFADYKMTPELNALVSDGEVPLFRLGNCLLLETRTSRGYSYYVIDITTNTRKHLLAGSRRISESSACDKIVKLDFYNESYEEENTADMSFVFKEILGGCGEKLIENHINFASEIIDAMDNRRIAIAEAGTDTGKIQAYIIASVFSRLNGKTQPVVISTSNYMLQRAIANDYIPAISKVLLKQGIIDKPLSGVICKGKSNYICDNRLSEYFGESGFARSFTELDLNDARGLSYADKRRIKVMGNCNPQCPQYNKCRYHQFLEYAHTGGHDFIICGHSLLLADIRRRKENQVPLIPDYCGAIIDEAHKLPQTARRNFGHTLSSNEAGWLKKQIQTLKIADNDKKQLLLIYGGKFAELSAELFDRLKSGIPIRGEYGDDARRFKAHMTEAIGADIENQPPAGPNCLSANLELLCAHQKVDISYEVKRLIYYVQKLTDELSAAACAIPYHENLRLGILKSLEIIKEKLNVLLKYEDAVCWLETRDAGNEVLLGCFPKNLDKVLYDNLWYKPLPVIFTSAALSANGDFTHFKKLMGISHLEQGRLIESSKPFVNTGLIYISESLPLPDNTENYFNAVIDETEKLIRAAGGHTVVEFTSFRVMKLVFEALKHRNVGYPLIRFDGGGEMATERFNRTKNGVLFVSGSMWQETDIGILSSLIVVKLPFAIPDPVSDYERTLYDSDEDYKNRAEFPEMTLYLKRRFGKLETDSGLLAVLDARVNAEYRQWILNAFPDCRITGDIPDVQSFSPIVQNHSVS